MLGTLTAMVFGAPLGPGFRRMCAGPPAGGFGWPQGAQDKKVSGNVEYTSHVFLFKSSNNVTYEKTQ